MSLKAITLIGLAGAAALAPVPVAGAEPKLAPPTSCEVQELPAPEGADSSAVTGAGPGGAPLVGPAYKFGDNGMENAAAIWDGDKVSTVDLPGGGSTVDINGRGVLVGYQEDAEQDYVVWVHDGTEFTLVPGKGKANAINDAGKIVGYRLQPTDSGPPISVPTAWPSPTDEPVDLERPNNDIGEAFDIAEDGTVVGGVGREAVVWAPDGKATTLRRPDGVPAETTLKAQKINGPWVVGGGYRVPVLWNLDTGSAEVVKGMDTAFSVNENGWVVGQNADLQGVLSAEGALVPLAPAGEDHMHYPRTISSDGATIGGMAQFRGNPSPLTETPVRWTCS